jgi:hypothetical protein
MRLAAAFVGLVALVELADLVFGAQTHNGVREATPEETKEIRSGSLWHLTGNGALIAEASAGTVQLDAADAGGPAGRGSAVHSCAGQRLDYGPSGNSPRSARCGDNASDRG